MGGWASHRSLEVTWGTEGATDFYYTANDDYDLVLFPLLDKKAIGKEMIPAGR